MDVARMFVSNIIEDLVDRCFNEHNARKDCIGGGRYGRSRFLASAWQNVELPNDNNWTGTYAWRP